MVVRIRRALKLLTILVIISVILIKRYAIKNSSYTSKFTCGSDGSNIRFVENGNRSAVNDVPHLVFVICGDRLDEALVMLKSAALFARSSIVVHIIAESALHGEIHRKMQPICTILGPRMPYTIYNTSFPTNTSCQKCREANWKTMFRPCASQRLFLPRILTEIDSVLYVDIDVLFLAPIDDIWSYLFKFNSTQFVAAIPVSQNPEGGYYNNRRIVPFIRPTGINSGVLLFNLTRLRASSWSKSTEEYFEKYIDKNKFIDQDLVNIFMHFHPEASFLIPCDWNYRYFHCSVDNLCRQAELEGVALLHGLSQSFINERNMAFKAVYRAFEQFQLGKHSIQNDLLPDIKSGLSHVPGEWCGKNPNIYTQRIEQYAYCQSHQTIP